MTWMDWIVGGPAIFGATFGALAAVGIVRMPDLYTRMQSATKAGTLGVACVVLAAALHFREAVAIAEAALVIVFLFATAPIASTLIARAAYVTGVPLWSRTGRDDLGDSLKRGAAPPEPGDMDERSGSV
jgi:multicomponent Na+:H+ antiporter subunit G